MGAASYDLDDISNTHAHLSNHCLAVDHPDYGKYEPTNELWYSQFDAWLQKTRGKRFEEAILPQVIPTPSHLLDRISPIFAPFFLVFCAFSPARRDGSNEPQAGTQGQETAGAGVQTAGNTVSPAQLTPGVGNAW